MRLYDSNIDEQQITELTGHRSIAVRNYKHTSAEKKKQVSDVLYRKKKSVPSSTISKAPVSEEKPDFNIGTFTQTVGNVMEFKPSETVHVKSAGVDIKEPIINYNQGLVTVQPVVNLNSKDLSENEKGKIMIPLIKVELTININ